MKINLLYISSLILLAGCSTSPNSMRSSYPDAQHTSIKPPKEIAICIANKWESYGVVNQREITGGVSLTSSTSGNLHYLADIISNEKVTTTKAYKFMSISLGANPFLTAVSECQL